MVAQLEHQQQQEEPCLDNLQKAKSLICALNFVSRNLPLPPDLFEVVSSICYDEQEGFPQAIDDGTQVEAGSDVARIAHMGSVSVFGNSFLNFSFFFFFALVIVVNLTVF